MIFNDPVNIIGIIIIAILLLLAVREIRCWYWKRNEELDILEKIADSIQSINLSYISLEEELKDIKKIALEIARNQSENNTINEEKHP